MPVTHVDHDRERLTLAEGATAAIDPIDERVAT